VKQDWTDYNQLHALTALRNRYLAVRHSIALSNVRGVINGSPESGLASFGLTPEGEELARTAFQKAYDSGRIDSSFVFVSSDFLRALQTAEIGREVCGVDEIIVEQGLRERGFGDIEEEKVVDWVKPLEAHDTQDPFHNFENVESPVDVLKRMTAVVLSLEEQYQDRNILLFSHGHPLRILVTGFKKISPSRHPELKLPANAEVFDLILEG